MVVYKVLIHNKNLLKTYLKTFFVEGVFKNKFIFEYPTLNVPASERLYRFM